MKQMIAYCGLDCEKCEAYKATITNDDALREKVAKNWAELNNAPITAEMINCLGCRSDGIKTPFCDSMCEIKKCASKKSGTCADCEKMTSCETLSFIRDYSEDAREI